AVGAVIADGVDVGGRGDLDGLVVLDADQPTLAALGDVRLAFLGRFDDLPPRQHGIPVAFLRLPVHIHQHTAHIRVADARRGVGVPGKRRATGATTGFIIRHVGAGGGVVHRLGLPGDHAIPDVDLPGAGTGAVHTVGGADHLVEGPAVAVEHIGPTPALEEDLLTLGADLALAQVAAQLEQGVDGVGLAIGGSHVWRAFRLSRERGVRACVVDPGQGG